MLIELTGLSCVFALVWPFFYQLVLEDATCVVLVPWKFQSFLQCHMVFSLCSVVATWFLSV